jgi:hypothetical protein
MTVSENKIKQDKLWVLHYRFGVAPSLWKVFALASDSNINDAISRAKQHCLSMNYKFVFLHPLVQDLDSQETMKKRSESSHEEEVFGGR